MKHINQISFDDFFLNQLNVQQQKAVAHKKGVLVVCAGAGSGKTRVITARIAHLILREQVDPQAILALTFTNKAGREMRDRIKHFLDTDYAAFPTIGTFHSYCLKLLKTSPQFYDSSFSLIDDDDQQKLLKTVLKKFSIEKKLTPRKAAAAISHIKNNGLSLQHIADPLLKSVYSHYEIEKGFSRVLDFDDLLLEVLMLFRSHSDFKKTFQEKVRHILIDEYQDTNHIQHQLLKHMALDKTKLIADSVCVVGDEDQSIYSWRGATITNILDFGDDFPKVTHITIDQNYRSVTPILQAANHIIKHNTQRREKKLWSERTAHDRIRILQCASEYHESDVIAAGIKEARMFHNPADIAVLYRSHYQSRTIEESLIRHAIPYKIIGGIQFYERQEIKDLLAYLKLAVNPFDRLSLTRIINTPARGLGQKFVDQFLAIWDEKGEYDFKKVSHILIESASLTKTKEKALIEFIELFSELDVSSATTSIEQIIKKINYLGYLQNSYEPEESQAKIENVHEFIQALSFFQEQGMTSLRDILDEISLMQDLGSRKQSESCVKLMTIHAAKGLEFPMVCIVGLEDGVFPSNHVFHDEQVLEEERRLMYVALTRAEERVLMTFARFRTIYGQLNTQRSSRFLREMPENIQQDDASHWSFLNTSQYMNDWFHGKFKPALRNSEISEHAINTPEQFSFEAPSLEKITYKKRQSIYHPHFGTGTIEKVEKKSDEKIYLTITFKSGTKKIDADYL